MILSTIKGWLSSMTGLALAGMAALAWWFRFQRDRARGKAERRAEEAARLKDERDLERAQRKARSKADEARKDLEEARRNEDRSGGLSNDRLRDD